MIYDCFTFFNELDLLEIRLNVLNDVVDKFVLVEATKTHSNQEKPLYFNQNKDRFKAFKDKIIHVIVSEYPEFETSWTIENYQRNCIKNALINCNDDDTIIISDLDEIPNPDKILEYKDESGIKAFRQSVFYYCLNNYSNEYWIYSRMLSYKDFKNGLDDYENYNPCVLASLNKGTTATKIRLYSGPKLNIIKDGGWHFGYLMTPELISHKIKSFSHQEFNNENFTDVEIIKDRIKKGEDLYGRKEFRYSKVEITKEEFPDYIVKNQEKFKEYILPNAMFQIKDYR